jgi:hypothetical protein
MDIKWRVILVFGLTIGFLITLILINVLTRIPDCPSVLPNEYYVCSFDSDCIFNPVFECVNRERDYYCIADEGFLASRERVSDKFYCRCLEGRCETFFIQES